MYFTFHWYCKVVIIIVQCIKAKPYHWPMYNIITIMARTFWQTSEALVWAGNVPAFTCVAHAYKFFQYACALNNACPQCVTEYVCINTWIEQHLLLSPCVHTRLVLWLVLLTEHNGLCGEGVLHNCCSGRISHFINAETQNQWENCFPVYRTNWKHMIQ